MDSAPPVRHAALAIMPAVAALCEGWVLVEQLQLEATPPERIRYRCTCLQRVLPVLPLLVVVVGIRLVDWMIGKLAGSGIAESLGTWAALPLALLIVGQYFGVTLTESTAIVHNLRRRTIQWSNVQAVRVERIQGPRPL